MAVFTEKLFHNYFLRYLFFTNLGFDDINTLWPACGRDGGRVLYVRDLSRGIYVPWHILYHQPVGMSVFI